MPTGAIDFLGGVLGGPSGAAPTGFEPQRSNNGVLRIVGVPGADVLVLTIASFEIPKLANAPLIVPYINEKRKFAGNPEYEDMPVTFNDYCDNATAGYLWNWRVMVYNPKTGKVGLKSQYAKQGTLTLFSPDDSIERVYQLVNIWPSAMDNGAIEYSGEEQVKISCTFTIDKFFPLTGFPEVNFGNDSIGANTGQ